jgi:hypothetical protein
MMIDWSELLVRMFDRAQLWDPASILGYGAIGLGLLLLILAYRLLSAPNFSKERERLALVLIEAA